MIVCTRVSGVVVDLLLGCDDVDLAWSVGGTWPTW
jgi:hypothetical protein